MNDTEFAFIRLIKLNTERPVQRTNPSFLRFVKCMRMDLSSNELKRVFVTLFGLVKNEKRNSSIMMWKLREENEFILQINGSCLSPLNMALVCISFSQLGIQLT